MSSDVFPPAHRSRPCHASGGFTLIELLIAVVVLGILTMIAYPQYSEFVMRSRIVDATAGMSDYRTRMEQFFQDNRRYDDGGGACGVQVPATASFTFACAPVGAAPAQGYTVTAAGAANMSAFSYLLTVTPAGVTRTTGALHSGWTMPAPNNCWAVRKSGKCT